MKASPTFHAPPPVLSRATQIRTRALLTMGTIWLFLLAIVAAVHWEEKLSERRAHDARMEQAVLALKTEIESILASLMDIAAFATTSGTALTAERFNQFINISRMLDLHPALRAVAFAPKIEGEVAANRFAIIQRDPVRKEEGYPPFEIKPPGIRPVQYPAVYYAPIAGNVAISGYDLWSDPARRSAASAAIDTGAPHISEPVVLTQDEGNPKTSSLAIVPMYRVDAPLATIAMRRDAVIGLVPGALDLSAVFARLPEVHKDLFLSLSIVDIGRSGSNRNQGPVTAIALYGGSPVADGFVMELDIGGRLWQIVAASQSPSALILGPAALWAFTLALVVGVFVLLVGMTVIRHVMSTGIDQSQLLHVAIQPMAMIESDNRVLWINEAWRRTIAPPVPTHVDDSDSLEENVQLFARSVLRNGLEEAHQAVKLTTSRLDSAFPLATVNGSGPGLDKPPIRRECRVDPENTDSPWLCFEFIPLRMGRIGVQVVPETQQTAMERDRDRRRLSKGVVERMVQRRTKELEQARIRAESANRAKSHFLANMSHELRTPLNAVIGFADVMRSEIYGPIGSPRYVEYLDDILRSGRHLLALISDMLDLAKIEAGKLDITEESVDLRVITESVCGLVADRASARAITLSDQISGSGVRIRGDALRIKQCMLNLLTNAIKFSEPNQTVLLEVKMDSDGTLALRVTDNGRGMDAEQAQRALRPFEQISGTPFVTADSGGTGLGLPITLRLMELHQGTIELQSAIGTGTTAIMRFPASRILTLPGDLF